MVFGGLIGAVLGFFSIIFARLFTNRELFPDTDGYFCCAGISLQLEQMDVFSSASILDKMRWRAEPDAPLAHDGERLFPNIFDGVWWMHNNPAPEVLFTTADIFSPPGDSNWRNPTLDIEGGTWAYNDSPFGRILFTTQCNLDVRPKVVLTENNTRFDFLGGGSDANKVTYIDDDTYFKPILGGNAQYTLRRIINADGEETDNWPIWVDYWQGSWFDTNKLLTYRRRDDETCHFDFL